MQKQLGGKMAYRDTRNVLAFGDNGEECQRKLYNSRVLTVGSDLLSQMILGGLAGLSVGHIAFIDNARIDRNDRDFLCSHGDTIIGQKKVRHVEDTLKRINQVIQENIVGIHSKFAEAFVFEYKPEVVIDATNDPISKEKALRYSIRYCVPFISASSDGARSAVAVYVPRNQAKPRVFSENPNLEALLMQEFSGSKQGSFSSGIAAGLVCEELRKIKFKYAADGRDDSLKNNFRLVYNMYSDTRTGMIPESASMPVYFKNKKALVAGAGGIGNFVALNLALLGFGVIDVLDIDTIEDHNLNRQILLFEREGGKKAEVIAERVKAIDPFAKSNAYAKRVGEVVTKDRPWLEELYRIDRQLWKKEGEKRDKKFLDFEGFVNFFYGVSDAEKARGVTLLQKSDFSSSKYDVIFGCFDNKYARIWLNNFAVENRIPYVDGGTGPREGQVSTYIPGATKCVSCQKDLMNWARRPFSCANAEGSVVMSNIVIGSAMVGEALRVLYSIGVPNNDKI